MITAPWKRISTGYQREVEMRESLSKLVCKSDENQLTLLYLTSSARPLHDHSSLSFLWFAVGRNEDEKVWTIWQYRNKNKENACSFFVFKLICDVLLKSSLSLNSLAFAGKAYFQSQNNAGDYLMYSLPADFFCAPTFGWLSQRSSHLNCPPDSSILCSHQSLSVEEQHKNKLKTTSVLLIWKLN